MLTTDLEAIDPTAGGTTAKLPATPRPEDLAGKVVALLDNTKEQGDIILAAVAEALLERYGVARVITRRKAHYSKPAAGELLDELAREADIAVAALGG
jgi:hypothetical protein